MRVLHITPGFPPMIGGVETFVADLARWQAARGYAVAVIAGTTEADASDDDRYGFQVYRLPFVDILGRQDLSRVIGLRRRIASLVSAHAPQIIHLHPVAAEMIFMRDVARLAGPPVVTTLHVDIAWQPALYRNNLANLLVHAQTIVAVSRSLQHDVGNMFADQAGKLHVVENGLTWRNPIEMAAEPGGFLYLGRLVREKGVDIALHAMALLVDHHPDIHLTIAGDGPERQTLEALANTLGLGTHVAFLGQIARDQVPALITRHVALIMPSRWQEPFGLVVVEAAMAGRPAIVSAVGALCELVTHGATGLQVMAENPADLAAAMRQLAQTPEQAHRMGVAAGARAAVEWSIDRAGAAYEKLYANLVGAHAAPQAVPR